MSVKTILYIVIIPLCVWGIESINVNGIFKKNREFQATLLYLMLSLGLSYLVVNCLYDFFAYSKFV